MLIRCDGRGPVFYSQRHIRALLDDDACRDLARRDAAIADPAAPPYVLMGEDEARRLGDRVEVVLLSEGSGPQGKQRTALTTPRRGAAPAGDTAADPGS